MKAVTLPPPQAGANGTVLLKIQTRIDNPPNIFRKRPFRLRYRVYVCPPAELAAHNPKKKKIAPCLTRFYEQTGTAPNGKGTMEFPAPANWTHAFVQLMDVEEIAGRFSPGHNPRWFRNASAGSSKQGSVSLSAVFAFESQENPLPDALQEKLAARFAPIIVVKKGKKFIPTNLEKYAGTFKRGEFPMKDRDMRRLKSSKTTLPYLALKDQPKGGPTHLYYHVRYADTMVSGAHKDALPGWRDDTNYRYRRGKGDIVVSYWMWYDNNEGPTSFGNVHQGDLESFAVLADARGLPKRFMVTGHDYIMLDTAWTNINSVNHHPIIYIAHGNKGADGGNPTSAYGDFEVKLDAGNALFNVVSDPRDIFSSLAGKAPSSSVILPADLDPAKLGAIRIGPGKHIDAKATNLADLRPLVLRKIARLVKWEEPGWVNRPAVKDPDGHHRVDARIAPFLVFPGRIGKHPQSKMNWGELTRYGQSPENVPFKTNVEQHYTFEKPRKDRFYKGREGDYSPRFKGDSKTPQFVN